MTLGSGITIRSAEKSDDEGIRLLVETSFGFRHNERQLKRGPLIFPPEEAIVAVDGERVVGNVRSRTMTVTVPGERTVEATGIAAVGVAPTHRRRGILRAMYTEQHRRTEEAGLPLTIFTASEGGIYGRFGYGPAVRENSVSIDRRFAQFRPTTPDPGGVELVPLARAEGRLEPLYDRWRRLVPGAQVRPKAWWGSIFDAAPQPDGNTPFALVHPDGYALYRHHYNDSVASVEVIEFRAVTTEAHAALWRTLFGLDLVQRVDAVIGDNNPLPYLLTNPRLVRTTQREDGLWARLMDVPAALAARTYRRDLDVVLAVTDPFRAAGGTFALRVRDGIAECEPTTRSVDVELGIDVLGSMYLGAYPARAFAAANRLQVKDAAHLRALDDAFASDRDAVLGWFF
ncbi:GNAT family N-acetyltransferase [Nocardia sp. NPDC052566]|uniref:GNAT family N-acetyltransferase n=1 Tax=Nocardia sp. NPDC052566 TaxID=3364330 RepID=UPI0037CC70AE